MRIGAALVLIAVGAILRFAISTTSTHGIGIHTTGDILMIVGIVGLVLVLVILAFSGRNRVIYRREVPPDDVPPPARYPVDDPYDDELRRGPYRDQYRR
ncbi:MAG: hypothetical protein JO345_36780 [Streptosporangiaceae bacterium]|nr:hypothetical protein [Streptosporangiaceae bacterium]